MPVAAPLDLDFFATLVRLQSDFLLGGEREALWQRFLDALLSSSASSMGFVAALPHGVEERPGLRVLAARNPEGPEGDDGRTGSLSIPEVLFGPVLSARKPVIVRDGAPGIRTFLGVPLCHGDRMVGVIALANNAEGYPPDLVDALAPFFEACLAFMCSTEERPECEDLREALFASEERFRGLLDSIPDLVCLKDAQGRWMEANRAALEFLGLQGKDYRGKTDGELARLSSIGREAFLACERADGETRAAAEGGRRQEMLASPGEGTRIFDVHKVPLFGEDEDARGWMKLGRDVTEQHMALQNLTVAHRQQEIINVLFHIGLSDLTLKEQLNRALDEIYSLPWLPLRPKGAIFLADEDGKEEIRLFVHKNLEPRLTRLCGKVPFGWCLCGKAARSHATLFADGVDEEHDIRFQGMEDHGHYVIPLVCRGTLHGVLCLYLRPGHRRQDLEEEFLRAVGNTLAILIEHKRGEEALQRGQARFARTQQAAKMGHWEWDLRQNRRLYSDLICEIFGRASSDGRLGRSDFMSAVHPDDREYVQNAVDKALALKRPYAIEYRIIRPDGRQRMLREEAEVVLDETGTVSRLTGIIQDVTLVKRTEDELLLAAKVLENSIEGVTITDAEGNIQMVNPAFTAITGYLPEEAVGANPRVLKSDRHDEGFYRDMWDMLVRTGQWQGEIWNRRKNGEVYPEWLTITGVQDARGRTTNYVAVFHDMSELRQHEEQARHRAYYDPLTLLPNRTLFQDRLGQALDQARRAGRTSAVLLLDLDDFKRVNSTFGYTFGDLVLDLAAKRIIGTVRDNDIVARYAADEFIVLVDGITREEQIIEIAMRMMKALSDPFEVADHELYLTCSVGITFFPADGEDAETLIKNAEVAMTQAKELGKNSYQLYTHTMNDMMIRRLTVQNDLRRAVERGEFVLYFQPKVQVATGNIVGCEALVRWPRPDGTMISPVEFIPIAEESGLIVPLGEWVLREACTQASRWLALGHPVAVAVNLSPRQFRQENLVEMMQGVLEETGLPGPFLELEVTEGAVMDNEETAIDILWKLRRMGVRVSIDDFGTGYSSLYYLKQLPLDAVKLDRAFVRDLPDFEDDVAIATGALSMAHALRLKVVAEGVEERAQLEFLKAKGFDEIQGFLCSPPVPVAQFLELLKKGRCAGFESGAS